MYRHVGAIGIVAAWCLLCGSALSQESSAPEETLPPAAAEQAIDFAQLKNPAANTRKSIARGKMMYGRYCTACHGPDGKAIINVISEAPDLTQPKFWISGTAEGEIFRSIRNGVGIEMPPYKDQIRREDDLWHLVNFIQSLWPESIRPDVVEETATCSEADDSEKRHEGEEKS